MKVIKRFINVDVDGNEDTPFRGSINLDDISGYYENREGNKKRVTLILKGGILLHLTWGFDEFHEAMHSYLSTIPTV